MDFYEFIADYGIIGLSISTALGISFNDVISNITGEFIIPLIGLAFGIKKFKDLHITMWDQDIFVGGILKSLISYTSIIIIIYMLAYYVFHDLILEVRRIKKEHEKSILEEQKKTSNTLQKLYELEKYNVTL